MIGLYCLILWCYSSAFYSQTFSSRKKRNFDVAARCPSLSATLNNDSIASPWKMNLMKQLAAEALLPVLYPPNSNRILASDNLQNIPSRTIDAERALKKLLGQYQKSITASNTTTVEERQASRKMLADLVLGTSVMRLLHFHTLVDTLQFVCNDLSIDDIEPVFGVTKDYNCTSKDTSNENRMKLVCAMVDIHLKYMTNQSKTPDFQNLPISSAFRFNTTAERISITQSLPLFFVQMLIDQYGENVTEKMANIFNEPGPITIRRNRIKCSTDERLRSRLLTENNISTENMSNGCIRLLVNDSWSPSKQSIWSLQSWKDGWFEVQDSGSQFIVKATEADASDKIAVDYCAGNGGKTLALASEFYRDGSTKTTRDTLIIAHDIVEERMRQLKGNLRRAGLDNDSAAPCNVMIKTTLDQDISLYEDMADLVLVDAPCSSSGVLRRRPTQRFILDKNEMQHEFPRLQLSILKEASRLVKIGGKLVYSTCSISRFENEDVVINFEGSCPDFGKNWQQWCFHEEESMTTSHFKALLPSRHGSDGFFVARWKRIR